MLPPKKSIYKEICLGEAVKRRLKVAEKKCVKVELVAADSWLSSMND